VRDPGIRPKDTGPRINHQIRAREVRVVDADGAQLGILPIQEALRLAESQDLDLVEVAASANPPVCRVMDFGKYRYIQKKKAQESKRRQTYVLLKEVKLGAQTDQHDIGFKVNHIRRFLEKGHRVKVSVFFRGRSITHPELGRGMLTKVFDKIRDIAQIDAEARLDGRTLSMLVSPKSK
jgi:translation initiation factor IF-3